MVYIHGGAWVIGDKREQGKPMMYELVARGWVCVAINYRLSPKATWPDHIVDVKRAVAWVKEHIAEYGGDPEFVAVSGGSAGGHLCALAALTAGDPAFQPGFEDGRHLGAGLRPLLRRHGHDGSDPRARAATARACVEMLEKTVMKTTVAEHPEVFRARLADVAGPRRRAALLRAARARTTPWSRSRWRGRSSSACVRCLAAAGRPTPSCPWPSTPSTCWPRCAARPPPRPWPTSSRPPAAHRRRPDPPAGSPSDLDRRLGDAQAKSF